MQFLLTESDLSSIRSFMLEKSCAEMEEYEQKGDIFADWTVSADGLFLRHAK